MSIKRTKRPINKGKNGGKTAMWRRLGMKLEDGTRTGRKIKAMMNAQNQKVPLLPIHMWLFKAAGISTPVLDAMMAQYTPKIDEDDVVEHTIDTALIEDAEIISEENMHVAI